MGRHLVLELGIWGFSGAWILALDAFAWSIHLLALAVFVLLSDHRPLLDLFALLQLAADRFVTGRNNFLALAQTVDDLHVGIITDPDLHRHHFDMIALDDENYFDGFSIFFLFVAFGDVSALGGSN